MHVVNMCERMSHSKAGEENGEGDEEKRLAIDSGNGDRVIA